MPGKPHTHGVKLVGIQNAEEVILKKLLALMILALSFSLTSPAQAARPAVTGTMTIEATSTIVHGGHVDITMVTQGRITNGSAVYTTLVMKQGSTKVVYARSGHAPYFSFVLEQQIGFSALGIFIDPTQPAEGSASLIYRQPSGKGYTYTFLDTVTFSVPAG